MQGAQRAADRKAGASEGGRDEGQEGGKKQRDDEERDSEEASNKGGGDKEGANKEGGTLIRGAGVADFGTGGKVADGGVGVERSSERRSTGMRADTDRRGSAGPVSRAKGSVRGEGGAEMWGDVSAVRSAAKERIAWQARMAAGQASPKLVHE